MDLGTKTPCPSPSLCRVIRRLITMHSAKATLEASHDAVLRQAESASAELRRRIEQEQQREQADKEGKGKKEEGVVS